MERSKWADLVDKIRDEIENSYFAFWVAENGDLRVSTDYVNNSWSVVTEEMPEFHAILEVVGPLEPGDWFNRHRSVGKGLSPMADDLRYIGKVPDDVAKSFKTYANLSGTGILTRITEPPSMVLDSD